MKWWEGGERVCEGMGEGVMSEVVGGWVERECVRGWGRE